MVPDPRGYLVSVDANLWCPLSDASLAAFENGSGSELTAKMRALHSASARDESTVARRIAALWNYVKGVILFMLIEWLLL